MIFVISDVVQSNTTVYIGYIYLKIMTYQILMWLAEDHHVDQGKSRGNSMDLYMQYEMNY